MVTPIKFIPKLETYTPLQSKMLLQMYLILITVATVGVLTLGITPTYSVLSTAYTILNVCTAIHAYHVYGVKLF